MQVGLIGLGRMGMNMARRLLKGGHKVVAYNGTTDRVKEIIKKGARGAYALEELVKKLKPPRIVWLMLPAGRPVDEHIEELQGLLDEVAQLLMIPQAPCGEQEARWMEYTGTVSSGDPGRRAGGHIRVSPRKPPASC